MLFLAQNCGRRPIQDNGFSTPLFRLIDNIDQIEFLEAPFPNLMGIKSRNSDRTVHPQLHTEVEKILSENQNMDSIPTGTSPPIKLKITKRPSARSGKGLRSRNVIAAPPTTIFSFSGKLAEKSVLNFGYGIVNESWKNIEGGVKFDILIENNDTGFKGVVFSQELNPKKRNQDRRWFQSEINLIEHANQKVTFIFKTTPIKANKDKNNCVSVWVNPAVIQKKKKHAKPNIILISIDTLRADHLGCYGYRRNTTPNIDAFAENGILFENAIAQAPYTVSSHMSMLTSLYPSFHKVNLIEMSRLHPAKQTLAEILYNNGYRTWAITGGGQVSSNYGFYDGFESFTEYSPPHKDMELKVGETLDYLKREKDSQFFIFFHSYKPHAPYTPRIPYNEMFDSGYEGKITGSLTDIEDINSGKIQVDQADLDHVVALYDGEIREVDDQLGILFDYLKKEQLMENTLIVFTSDHGEEFNEHGLFGVHSHTLYDELLHVPLICRVPQVPSARTVIKEQVQSIDIFPTILQIADIQYKDIPIQGTSFLPLIKNPNLKRNPNIAFSERTPSDGRFLRALRDSSQKYIFEEELKKGEIKHYYFNLINDPGEQFNLTLPQRKLRQMFNQVHFLIEEGKKIDEIMKTKKIDKETLETLKALGYIE
jgi:arylsulfatase A-like enzyme